MHKLFSILLFGIIFTFPAYAQAVSFNVDAYYDESGRAKTNATMRSEGENAKWFVDDAYWSKLSGIERAKLLTSINKLSTEFDGVIYPQLTALFGSENNPGIDNDSKVAILLLEMIEDAGGYFREQDGLSREKILGTNEREMIYLNVIYIENMRAKAFLAHELQHLITFNQKFMKHNLQEEVWLNELRSEIASTILGYDSPGSYGGSNLEARVLKFFDEPSDAILDWENQSKDYATINLFGQYILDHYGRSVVATMIGNDKIGVESFNEALHTFGFKEDFSEVFRNWALATLINDCAIEPIDTYCYKNPSLDYANFHIQFGAIEGRGESIISQSITKDWQADWLKLEKGLRASPPNDHILMLQFFGALGSNFRVPYVVYGEDSTTILEVGEIDLPNGEDGTLFVEDFGYKVPKVVIIPYNQQQTAGTAGNASVANYIFNASTIDKETREEHSLTSTQTAIDGQATSTQLLVELPDLPNGSLVRAENDYKVYIIQGSYKRWIQSSDIFDFYGHLNFEIVNILPAETVDLYKDSYLVRSADDKKVYEINGDGTRHWLDISPEEFSASGRMWDMVYIINSTELNFYAEGASVK